MAALLVASGFFSGSETALFSLTPRHKRALDKSGFLGAQVRSLLSNQHALLITLLLGNMLINVFYASLSLIAAASVMQNSGSKGAFVAVELGALIALIVFGEVVPKNIAITNPTFFAKISAPAMQALIRILGPVRIFFEYISRFFARIVTRGKTDEKLSPEHMEALVDAGIDAGVLSAGIGNLLAEVPFLRAVRVKEIMVPRPDVNFFNVSEEREALEEAFRSTNHSRLPVFDGSRENILGFVDGKEVFIHRNRDVRELLVPPFFVPETASVEGLLRDFKNHRLRMAIVVDEYGGVTGLVTIEDALETIVGEIEDEYDRTGKWFAKLEEGKYIVSGAMNLWDFLDEFDIERKDEKGDTVAGYVIALHGGLPEVGDRTSDGRFTFIVRRKTENRIRLLEVWLKPSERSGEDREEGARE
jgi:putative hemolysin